MEIFEKNPIYRQEYESDNWFQLFEAKRDWIVFRNQVSMYAPPGETAPRPKIDLIFVGVIYIEIPFELRGLKITKPKDNLAKRYSEQFDKKSWLETGERVYSIESENMRFNVVTSNLWIHEYKEQIKVSPLDYFYYGNIKNYNFYLSEYVKNWIKID